MASVAISAKPDLKVTGLSIKRDNSVFRATWKVPSEATKDSNGKRWTGIRITFYATVAVLKNGKRSDMRAYAVSYDWGTSSTACSYNMSSHLDVLFPRKETGHILKSVTCEVCGYNDKGNGPKSFATFTLATPPNPTLAIAFDSATNKVTTTVTAKNDASAAAHRHDTTLTVKKYGTGGALVLSDNSASTSTNRSVPHVIQNAGSLATGEWIRVTAFAKNRGWRGNGSTVNKTVYIAHPTVPSCGTPVIKWADDEQTLEIASILIPVNDAGKVVAKNVNGEKANIWPDTLYLERLRNSLATTPTEAAQSGSWEQVDGAEATGKASGLMDTWADATEEREAGKRTWYRVVAERDGYTQYGIPVCADCLFVPSSGSAQSDATIGEAKSGLDGESIIVPVSWTQNSVDGVELSWSIFEDAWHSNEQPSTLDVDWGENKAATATIRGLQTGVPVFVRARCYDLDSDGNRSYGGYSAAKMVVPYDAPDGVSVTVPAATAAGSEIVVEWTFGSGSAQQWADVLVDGTAISSADGGGGHTVSGSDGAAAIPSDGLSLGVHEVSVIVSTDGVTGIASESAEVIVAEAPTGSVAVTGSTDDDQSSPTYGSLVVTAQPLEVVLTTETESPSAIIVIVADGAAADELREAQPVGEVVWSATFAGSQMSPPRGSTSYTRTTDIAVNPAKTYYTKSGSAYTKVEDPTTAGLSSYYEYTGNAWAMTASDGLDIRDWCGYKVRCSLTDEATGLSSELEPAAFSVKWAHQAIAPDGVIEVSESELSATITVEAPSGAVQTDVLDLYRVTPGGMYLIASAREFGVPIMDPYAPFRGRRSDARLRYRAVLRTADGDMEFADIGYDLTCGSLRFDWSGNGVELPYDIHRGHSFSKDFSDRVHADGSRGGLWSPAVEHNNSLSTDLIEIRSVEQREALLDMARHAGPVFVRTPEGLAYCANANLGQMDLAANDPAIAVSVDAREIGMTDAFMAAPVVEVG